MLHLLQSISKWTAIGSLTLLLASLLYKDRLPEPGQYDIDRLTDPLQQSTFRKPFWIETGGQRVLVVFTPVETGAVEPVAQLDTQLGIVAQEMTSSVERGAG